MQANSRDTVSLWAMVRAIQEIQTFTAGLAYEDYFSNRMVQRAVERNLEILGEAARRLSDEVRSRHPQIDWRSIIGLRNILAHQYEVVRQEILWNIIASVLPDLLVQIEALLPPLPNET